MPRVIDLLRARVIGVLRLAVATPRAIRGDSRLGADLGLDSLAIVEVTLMLEERFDVTMPMATLIRMETVDELIDVLRSSLAQRRRSSTG